MSNAAIGMLYNAIPHPPSTFLGPEYEFRQADGGYNNVMEPDLGRAGTRYARSVQGKGRRGMGYGGLPEAGLVFDTLLKRKGVSVVLLCSPSPCIPSVLVTEVPFF
jgi:linoleate 10R-lipoxygenase